MKTVFTNSMVAHTWAQNTQAEGRSSNGSFYFDLDRIYSYGRHFLIAKFHTNENGSVVLFTTRSYSSSTSKHISYTRQAVNGQNLLFCYNPNGTAHAENFEQWFKSMDALAKQMLNVRKPEIYLNHIAAYYRQVKEYAKYFNLTIPADLVAISELQDKAQYAALAEAREVAAKEVKAKQAAMLKKEHALKLSKWRSFELQRLNVHNGFDYLRYNDQTDRIETSQEIQIPGKLAREFYTYVIDTIKGGGCVQCDKKLLDYQVKEINKEYIIVGCHRITIAEIKKAIKLMA